MMEEQFNIFDCFEEICDKNTSRIAVSCDGKNYTYSEFMSMIRSFDAFFSENSIQKGEKVAFWTDKSVEYIAGIMASIRRGIVFVPLDKKNPIERIQYILEDSNSRFVVQDEDSENNVNAKAVLAKEIIQKYSGAKFQDKPEVSVEDEAYMIYTSGTTGNPKGVVLAQKGLLSLAKWSIGELSLNNESRVTQYASISFDASIWEIFMTLLSGAQLHLLKYEVTSNPVVLSDYLKENEITVAFMPPFMANLVQFEGTKLKAVITGGCETNLAICKRVHSYGIDYFNAYGPTENTIITTWWKYDASKVIDGIIPIGKDVPNSSVCILDENKKEVEDGVTGEICITGELLAKGYYKNEELTNKKFFYLDGKWAYMSGDLGYINKNKDVIYLGRNDQQMKIRGFRIELPEIEMQISREFSPRDVKVLAIGNEVNNKILVAFLEGEEKYSPEIMKEVLSAKLPYYMVPSSFVFLKTFPHTLNGKNDSKELEKIYKEIQAKKVKKMATTECQKYISTIWQNILGLQNVGINEDFFDLGGNSLSYIAMTTELEKKYQIKIRLSDFMQESNIEFLERFIIENNSKDKIQEEKKVIEEKELYEKVSENIDSTWEQLMQISKGKVAYHFDLSSSQKKMCEKNNVSFIELSEVIKLNHDKEDINDLMTKVINANEVFRTHIENVNSELKNVVYEKIQKCQFNVLDLSAYSLSEKDEDLIDDCLKEKLIHMPNFEHMLYIFLVVKKSSNEYMVFFQLKHLVFDAASIFTLKKQLHMAVKGEITGIRNYREYINYLNSCDLELNYQNARNNSKRLETLIEYGKENKASKGQFMNELFEIPIESMKSPLELEKFVMDKTVVILKELFSKDKVMMRVTENARKMGREDFTNCLGDFHISVPVLISLNENNSEQIFNEVKGVYSDFYVNQNLYINEYAYGSLVKEEVVKIYESVDVGYNFIGLKDDKDYEKTKRELREKDKVHKNAFITTFASRESVCIICRVPMENREITICNMKQKLGLK